MRNLVARAATLALLTLGCAPAAPAQSPRPGGDCGEIVAVETSARTTTRYALGRSDVPATRSSPPVVLALLPGGSGNLDLDDRGCPRALKGNYLVRAAPIFQALGFATALIDAPSSHKDEDGLGAHRGTTAHARELGAVIADLRARTGAAVWVIGTSRGTISAANLAAQGRGVAAPDGVVLTSIVTIGDPRARRPWVAQTVFDHPLDAIAVPILLVGHAADACLRSPASQLARVAERLTAARRQVVVVAGGPGGRGQDGLEACEGRSPHGFVGQEREVAEGIARFVRGGAF